MRTLGLGLLLGVALLSQGCAIFVRGDQQDVVIQSQVPEVRIEVDGKPAQLGTFELDRGRVHVIHAEAPGYDTLDVTVYPSVNDDWLFGEQCTMWPVLWLPMAIDYNSGALNDLPTPIDLQLSKSKAPPATAQGEQPSTTVPVAEVKEVKIVIKKPPAQYDSIRHYRTSRTDLKDGY